MIFTKYYLYLIIGIGLLISTACTNDELPEGVGMEAIINGDFITSFSWQANGIGAVLDEQDGTLTITGTSANNITIVLVFNSTQTGSYALTTSPNAQVGAMYLEGLSASPFAAYNGMLQLLSFNEIDNTVSGSFEFQAQNALVAGSRFIDEGVFLGIPYVTE